LAEALDPLQFEVKTYDGRAGNVRLRFSYLPYGFQRGPEKNDKGNPKLNERWGIMSDNNAFFIVTRAGRQIDLVTRARFKKDKFNFPLDTYDCNWAVELDFDPVLDEEFGITVNKQQVNLSERMWDILDSQVAQAIYTSLHRRYYKEAADRQGKAKEGEENISESIMVEAEKFRTRPVVTQPEKQEEARKKLIEEATQEAETTRQPVEKVIEEKANQTAAQPYEIKFEALEGAPFYRPELYGVQKRIWINTRHRFYTDIYNGPDASPRLQVAIRLLLYVLGCAELEATEDREIFYRAERSEWSKQLDVVLDLLDRRAPVRDAKSASEANGLAEG
jgi:hypothetical protein